jgi:SSS family solute:Na+ symporter
MAMTSSDANAISAVVIRDIIPALRGSRQPLTSRAELLGGRISTFLFIGLSMVIALSADSFGGVLGLIILWFGALVGPIAVPMLLGMLRPFRRCGPSAALFSWATGLLVFALAKYVVAAPIASLGTASAQTINVAAPVLASAIVYCVFGWLRPWHNEASDALVESLDQDLAAATSVPVASTVG